MVGGTIIGIAKSKDSSLIHVQDKKDTCRIRILEKTEIGNKAISVEIGDRIWWQSGHAYWTPKKNYGKHNDESKGGVDYDIRLTKIGYSH